MPAKLPSLLALFATALLCSPALRAEAPNADATPSIPAEGDSGRAEWAKKTAKAAMESWLGLIEEGKYLDSWRAASPPFQQSVGAGRWAMTCRNQRKPTGKLISRTLSEEHYHTEFYKPNGHLTQGEMVTFLFTTEFEHLKAAREVVILCPFGPDWKVVSYALKPKFD